MDQVHVIRHKHAIEGQSVRQIARQMGIHRATVRKYLGQPEPRRVERGPRGEPVMATVGPRIDSLVQEWGKRTGGKHRITSTRVHRQLIGEGFGVGERTVRKYLSEKRRQAAEVYIPLVHRAGDEAQVDFFEVTVDLAGKRTRVWKFLLRLMHSKRDLVWLYERCNQVSFLDGHVRAFASIGAVPRRVVYDNLTAAVKRRVRTGERELNERFMALCAHYCYEPCFARPGEGHDKGGVEGRGKTIRLQLLTPIVEGATLADISRRLQDDLDKRWEQAKAPDGRLPGDLYDEDQFSMKPLPATPFEAREVRPVSVSRSATVTVMGAVYSVPTSWARLDATAYIGVEDIRLVCRGNEHIHRLQPKGGKAIHYRDYLPELSRKPQAVRQVAPELLAQLGEPYGKLWSLLEATHGQLKAARVLSGILGAINDHGEPLVSHALVDALASAGASGGLDQDRLLISLAGHLPARPSLQDSQVPAALRLHVVHAGCAADYDQLLAGGDR
jgi:transposase